MSPIEFGTLRLPVVLQTGEFYWMKHEKEQIWRVIYAGEDNDGNQWIHGIGYQLAVKKMDLQQFHWKHIERPNY